MLADPAFTAPGRFFKGNVHTHSTRSDAVRSPEEVCRLYREAGYDFVAITDHFLAEYGFPLVDTRPYRTDDFTTLIGAELHAPQTRVGEIWHILAVGLPLDFAPLGAGETGPQLAQRAIDAGALVALPHPTWYGLDAEDAQSIPNAQAVEIYNHTGEVHSARGEGTALVDQLLNRGRRLSVLATDDAHFKDNDWFGGFVMVKAATLTPEALLASLKAGLFYATQGPLIHSIVYADDHVDIACSPASAVIVLGRAAGSQQIFGNNLTRVTLPINYVLPGGFARVVVVDAYGRKAWSNPLWFDDAGHDQP